MLFRAYFNVSLIIRLNIDVGWVERSETHRCQFKACNPHSHRRAGSLCPAMCQDRAGQRAGTGTRPYNQSEVVGFAKVRKTCNKPLN